MDIRNYPHYTKENVMADILKQNINFLEYPLWSITNRNSKEISYWVDNEKYQFKCIGKMPNQIDILYLYYILLECQNQNWTNELIFTKYQIMNGCGFNKGKINRNRLDECLDKWHSVVIKFKGTFYDNKKYIEMKFHIIESVKIREDKKIIIRLNNEWVTKIKNSHFFKYISFNDMRALRSPLAMRLYELLIKTFHNREDWQIDVIKLAEKIPMAEKYITHIIPKIRTSVKRINDKTELKVSMKVIRKGRNNALFVFTKKNIAYTIQKELFNTDIENDILCLIPNQFIDNSRIICNEIIDKSDKETLKRCIIYANSHNNVKNYGALLRKIYKDKLYENDIDTKPIPELKPGMIVYSYKSLKQWRISKELTISENGEIKDKDFILEQIKNGKYDILH